MFFVIWSFKDILVSIALLRSARHSMFVVSWNIWFLGENLNETNIVIIFYCAPHCEIDRVLPLMGLKDKLTNKVLVFH